MGGRGAGSRNGGAGGAGLTSTAKYVHENIMGGGASGLDAYGNYYYLENGNVYMEEHFYKHKYDTSKGWLPVDAPAGVQGKYLAPGSKDYAKIKDQQAKEKSKAVDAKVATGRRLVETWQKKGFGGESMRPYGLYKLAKKDYGLKMSYAAFQRKGVDGIYDSLRDNKQAINGIKKYLNPKVDSRGNLYFSSTN